MPHREPQRLAGTVRVRRVKSIDALTKHQQGRAGIWAVGQGSSFFDNSREITTVDPTEHEESLDKFHRALGPLRENGTGRVIV